ncbi:MAG: Nif3-like dinuclear metal center hexameric protein [Planctomycetaceae bacterium]|nr:Nif3-like dinuclear metal center hexameric protein [Planctomycetaceae bacterium]
MALGLETVVRFLETRYPLSLAESWDNVGLLVGDCAMPVRRIMTCLTVTPESCREAVEQQVDLIVTHHPFPFQAVRQITTETTGGRMLWQLIRAGVAVYSAHTAFDSAATGINQQIAEMLGLIDIATLYPQPIADHGPPDASGNLATPSSLVTPPQGTGRVGMLPQPVSLRELVEKTAQLFRLKVLPYVGDPDRPVQRVAIGCGAAGEFLEQAIARKADVFLVGEAKFHQYLEASANRIALILPGHYASERFAVEQMADVIADRFRDLDEPPTVWPSRRESNPQHFYVAVENSQ